MTREEAKKLLPFIFHVRKVQTVHTAFNDDWDEFITLRAEGCSGAVHPGMKVVANMIKKTMYGN